MYKRAQLVGDRNEGSNTKCNHNMSTDRRNLSYSLDLLSLSLDLDLDS
jgi:hypothetical protein